MEKLFEEIETGYDAKNRQVSIIEDEKGFCVYVPRIGYKSKYFKDADSEELRQIFNDMVSNSSNQVVCEPTEEVEEAAAENADTKEAAEKEAAEKEAAAKEAAEKEAAAKEAASKKAASKEAASKKAASKKAASKKAVAKKAAPKKAAPKKGAKK